MLFYYWKTKGIRPSFFRDIPSGELSILIAFYELEQQEAKPPACPLWGAK